MTAYFSDVRHMLEDKAGGKIYYSAQDAGSEEL